MIDYRPDDDPTNPGILTVITNLIPTSRGTYRNKAGSAETGYTTLGGTCVGAALLKSSDGTLRLIAATATAIKEASTSGSTWNDESRTTGGAYSSAGSWDFAQYGTVALAASYENVLQASVGGYGASFENVTGSPQGKHIVVNNNRVILFNTQGYTGSGQDGWAASDIGDYTVWTPAASNNAAQGRLISSGPITAAASLGGLLIAWKLSEMWIGTDYGPPDQILWQRVPGGRFGCISKYAWVGIDAGIIFVGPNDIWFYDGSRPRSIAEGVRNEFFRSSTLPTGINLQHDEISKNVIFYRNDNSNNWVYNYVSGKWGRQTGYNGSSGNISIVLNANNEDLYNFGSGVLQPYIVTNRSTNFVFPSSTNKLTNATGTINGTMQTGSSSSITTGYVGQNGDRQTMNGIIPQFILNNLNTNLSGVAASVTAYRAIGLGATGSAATFSPNNETRQLDGFSDGNFFRASITITDSIQEFELKDILYRYQKSGRF